MTKSVALIGGTADELLAAEERWICLGWPLWRGETDMYRAAIADSIALFEGDMMPGAATTDQELLRLCIAIAQYRQIPVFRADTPGAPLVVPQVLLSYAQPERLMPDGTVDVFSIWKARWHALIVNGTPCASPLDQQRDAHAEVSDGSEGDE